MVASRRVPSRSVSAVFPAPIGPSIAMCRNCNAEPMISSRRYSLVRAQHRVFISIVWALSAYACASTSVPVKPGVSKAAPPPAYEQKMARILRLEDRRVLKDPEVPGADLVRLLSDDQPRVRRRAALAVGRVGLTSSSGPLLRKLGD